MNNYSLSDDSWKVEQFFLKFLTLSVFSLIHSYSIHSRLLKTPILQKLKFKLIFSSFCCWCCCCCCCCPGCFPRPVYQNLQEITITALQNWVFFKLVAEWYETGNFANFGGPKTHESRKVRVILMICRALHNYQWSKLPNK